MANRRDVTSSYSRRFPATGRQQEFVQRRSNFPASQRWERSATYQNDSRGDWGKSFSRTYFDNKRRNLDSRRWRKNSYDSNSPSSERDSSHEKVNGKIRVSNLGPDVNTSDVKELFEEFGALIKAEVQYDNSGRTLGTAYVVFKDKVDATKAMEKYNEQLLDGQPMKIEMIATKEEKFRVSQNRSKAFNRFRGRPQRWQSGTSSGSSRGLTKFWNYKEKKYNRHDNDGGRKKNKYNSPVTAEQLDKELDEYLKLKGSSN